MNKTPRETKTDIDLTTLVSVDKLMEDNAKDDCFGREWDPQDKDCTLCHDVEICGIVAQEQIKKKTKKLEKEKGPFLDSTAFEKVPIDKIVATITAWADEGDPATLDELIDDISAKAKTKDIVAVKEYIKRILPKHGLKLTKDKTIVPDDSSNNHKGTEQPLTPKDPV